MWYISEMRLLLVISFTDPLVITVGVIVVLLAAAIWLQVRTGRSGSAPAEPEAPTSPTYALRPMLFTPAELNLVTTLEQVIPAGYKLYGKVRLADIFQVRQEVPAKIQRSRFLQISSKHIDFVIIRVRDAAPLAGIELDDASHDREDRVARDSQVNQVFTDAGLPLVRIKAARSYQTEKIREILTPLFSP
jgi:hypothetical protein